MIGYTEIIRLESDGLDEKLMMIQKQHKNMQINACDTHNFYIIYSLARFFYFFTILITYDFPFFQL